MNLEQAKEKVRNTIREISTYSSNYEVDENAIVDYGFAWYIPFRGTCPDIEDTYVGVYQGFIVGKQRGDLYQPGSSFSIEKWVEGYGLGLLDGPHDLVITKIHNKWAAGEFLEKLNLTYYKPEIENGVTWKIPGRFTRKMIEIRLGNLPCKFRNQRFVFNIDQFKEIKRLEVFDFELIKTVDAMPNEIGEKME